VSWVYKETGHPFRGGEQGWRLTAALRIHCLEYSADHCVSIMKMNIQR
jgi:hypothetical protein